MKLKNDTRADVIELITALRKSWSAETAFDSNDWTSENPARGQCVVSALVVQDYLGGDLQRFEARGESIEETHYANLLEEGVILDTTASQYARMTMRLTATPTNLKGYATIRDKRLADEVTYRRYELLKSRVQAVLARL